MKNSQFGILTLLLAAVILCSCEKETVVKVQQVEPLLEFTPDTVVFNGNEMKTVLIKSDFFEEFDYQIVNMPNWIDVASDYGNDIAFPFELQMTSNFTDQLQGVYYGNIEFLSTAGAGVCNVKGFAGENFIYSIPEEIDFIGSEYSKQFVLNNEGNVTIDFSLAAQDEFVEFSTSSGSVEMSEQARITVNVDHESMDSDIEESKIFVTLNDVTDTITLNFNFADLQKSLLPIEVKDAEYSKTLNKLCFISPNSSLLTVFNATDNSINQLDVNYLAQSVSVSPDGTKVAVGQDGKATYVDLNNLTVIQTVAVPINIFDIALKDNGWAYATSEENDESDIYCIDFDNALYVGVDVFRLRRESWVRIHPSGNFVYAMGSDYSNADIHKLDISTDTANYLYASPYDYDVLKGYNFWYAEDGGRIFTAGGAVLYSSSSQDIDMTTNGTISLTSGSGSTGICWLDHNQAVEKLFIIAEEGNGWYEEDPNFPFVYIHNSNNLIYESSIELESYVFEDAPGVYYDAEPRFVFSNELGVMLYVVTKAAHYEKNGSWAIQSINL
jgi:hypothetical protein